MVDIYGAIDCAATLYFAKPDALKVSPIIELSPWSRIAPTPAFRHLAHMILCDAHVLLDS